MSRSLTRPRDTGVATPLSKRPWPSGKEALRSVYRHAPPETTDVVNQTRVNMSVSARAGTVAREKEPGETLDVLTTPHARTAVSALVALWKVDGSPGGLRLMEAAAASTSRPTAIRRGEAVRCFGCCRRCAVFYATIRGYESRQVKESKKGKKQKIVFNTRTYYCWWCARELEEGGHSVSYFHVLECTDRTAIMQLLNANVDVDVPRIVTRTEEPRSYNTPLFLHAAALPTRVVVADEVRLLDNDVELCGELYTNEVRPDGMRSQSVCVQLYRYHCSLDGVPAFWMTLADAYRDKRAQFTISRPQNDRITNGTVLGLCVPEAGSYHSLVQVEGERAASCLWLCLPPDMWEDNPDEDNPEDNPDEDNPTIPSFIRCVTRWV